jgi:hypothetical protein
LYLGAPQKIQEKIIYNPYLHIELKLGIFGVARKPTCCPNSQKPKFGFEEF